MAETMWNMFTWIETDSYLVKARFDSYQTTDPLKTSIQDKSYLLWVNNSSIQLVYPFTPCRVGVTLVYKKLFSTKRVTITLPDGK